MTHRGMLPIAFAALFLTPLAQAQSTVAPGPAPSNPQRDIEVIKHLEEDYLRAEIEDDSTIARTILADDYVGLKPDGSTSNKSEILARLEQHERRRQPYQITATNMREHLFGDTACVSYTKVYTRPGIQTTFGENVLHVLIRRNGIWRIQLSSPLPSPRAQAVPQLPQP